MKQAVLLTIMCFASSLLGSVVTVAIWPDAPEESESVEVEANLETEAPAPTVPTEITVRKIVFVDARGQTRMVLAALNPEDQESMHEITIYDSRGTPKLVAGLDDKEFPYIELSNSSLPGPDHKRVALSVDARGATVELGHGEVEEILLRSALPTDTTENQIRLRGRNSSSTTMYLNEYGHATIEVKDFTDRSVMRVPQWQPLFPETDQD